MGASDLLIPCHRVTLSRDHIAVTISSTLTSLIGYPDFLIFLPSSTSSGMACFTDSKPRIRFNAFFRITKNGPLS